MRIFVAVECGAVIPGRAAAAIERFRERLPAIAPGARVTWASPERLHLTIRFVGEVAAAAAAGIAAALAPPIPVPPFDFAIGGFATFPERGAPRVIWAGVIGGLDGLRAIEREVTARLQPLGVPPEARRYWPHLTLGRVRDAAGLRAGDLLAGLADAQLGTAHADAVTLFESRLSPKGAAYVALRRTPLTPAP